MARPFRLRIRQNRRELGMFAIIGIVVVFGCMVAGYLMEHGNLRVLVQPAELIIIGGAASGTVLDRESSPYPQEDRWRHRCCFRRHPSSASRPTSTL